MSLSDTSSPMSEAHKKALVVAFFLSKFDRKGVAALGFQNAEEAFTTAGNRLGVKASTIKNMRDSFDPYCSHVRKGWYQRPILRSRANIIAAYDQTSEAAMLHIVQTLLSPATASNEIALYTAPVDEAAPDIELSSNDTPFAARIRTGEEAEAFFAAQFPQLSEFHGAGLEDTRKFGIGFDFRVTFPGRLVAVEVKGLREARGAISFTDKEWGVAGALQGNFYLALVRSLNTAPELDLIANPAARLPVTMRTVESVTVLWTANM